MIYLRLVQTSISGSVKILVNSGEIDGDQNSEPWTSLRKSWSLYVPKATDFGDDKDRVVRKWETTYFTSDIVYCQQIITRI